MDASAAVIWNTTAQGELMPPQPRWAAYTGQGEEAYQGWGWVDAVHPDDRARAAEVWAETIGGAPPAKGDMLLLTPARHGCDGFFVAVLERKG